MKTATRALILASLFGAGCSASGGNTDITPGPTGTGTGTGVNPPVSGNPTGPDPVVNPTGPGPTGGPAPTGTGVGPTGTSGQTGPGPVTTPPPPPTECVPGVPATSQVPRMLNFHYDNALRDLLGITAVSSKGNQRPSLSLVSDLEGSITSTAWNAYLDMADAVAAQVMAGENKSMFISCDPAEAACLEETVKTFGRKAFRRPLTEDEVAKFMGFNDLEPKGTPEEVAEAILFAFLASPSFLMLPELGQTAEGTAIKLTDHEIATRLSFLIWGSIPDEELNAVADAGMLNTPEQITAQAQRMVTVTEKTGPLMADYHRFYTGIRNGSHWFGLDHDKELFPKFTDAVNEALPAEIDLFFADVAANGSFADLYTSPVAYVNQATAPIYGLEAADFGPDLERVELDPAERPGYLTRAGFLSSFSRYSSTSPILRGAFIIQNVLNVKVGAPDPNALTATVDGQFTTYRDYVTELTKPANCVGCHTVINAPGFVFEVFDSVGSVQTKDPLGGDINSTATITVGTESKEMSTPAEMMAAIAASDAPRQLYAEKWVSYATSRDPNGNDRCTVDEVTTKLAESGAKISDVLPVIAQADSFRLRTVGN